VSVSVRPARSFTDLATMIGPKNPQASVCWRLSHRLDSRTNKELVGPQRGQYVKKLAEQKVAPGVLAYDDTHNTAAVAGGIPRVLMRKAL
jgi:hypothetical protein